MELRLITSELVAKARETGEELEHLSSHGASSMDKLSNVGKAAFTGLATAGVAVGAMSLEMADQFEKSHARLEGAIANTGASFEEFQPQVASVESTLEGFGHSNSEVESALAPLVAATHNTGQALGEMTLAANIAAGRNISLADATAILTKVATGHVALLGKLGIATKNADGTTISQTEALKKLSAMYGGDAARTAETFAGKTLALKTKLEDVAKNIGLALIPILEKLAGIVESVVSWFEKHINVAYALAALIGGVLTVSIAAWVAQLLAGAAESVVSFATWVAGFLGVGAAEEGMAVAGEEAGAATTLALGPIGLAVAAIGIAAYELYNHWQQVWGFIKAIAEDAYHFIADHIVLIVAVIATPLLPLLELYKHWDEVWGDIKAAAGVAWDFLRDKVFGPIVGAFTTMGTEIKAAWHATGEFFSSMWDGIKDAWATVTGWFKTAWKSELSFWEGLPGSLLHTFDGMFDGITSAFKSAINWVIDAWNGLSFTIPAINTHIPGVGKIGGQTISVPKIPHVALGGPVAAGMLHLVGEQGPELFVPNGNGTIIPNDKLGGGGAPSGPLVGQIIMSQPATTAADIADELAWRVRVGALAAA
jgi:hypothetical protein